MALYLYHTSHFTPSYPPKQKPKSDSGILGLKVREQTCSFSRAALRICSPVFPVLFLSDLLCLRNTGLFSVSQNHMFFPISTSLYLLILSPKIFFCLLWVADTSSSLTACCVCHLKASAYSSVGSILQILGGAAVIASQHGFVYLL